MNLLIIEAPGKLKKTPAHAEKTAPRRRLASDCQWRPYPRPPDQRPGRRHDYHRCAQKLRAGIRGSGEEYCKRPINHTWQKTDVGF